MLELPLLGGIGGWAFFWYDGNIDGTAFPSLTSIAGNVEVNRGISTLDLTGININGAISSVGSLSGQLWLTDATTVDVSTAEVTHLTAPAATTVNLDHTDDIPLLLVNAPLATTINVATDEIGFATIIKAVATSTVN